MTKKKINYFFKLMGRGKMLPDYLDLHKAGTKWWFVDNRTEVIDGEAHVFPIGVNHHSFYVINPFNGGIDPHGIVKDYAGHRTQGYHLRNLKERKNPTAEEVELIERINYIIQLKNNRRRKKVNLT